MEDKSCKTPRWRLLKNQLNNLSATAFLQKINSVENPIVIDVRTPSEFATGHLDMAININYLADDFWDRIEAMNNKEDYFFVYCRSGRRSIRACTLMRNGGFDNSKVFNLDVGFSDWPENLK